MMTPFLNLTRLNDPEEMPMLVNPHCIARVIVDDNVTVLIFADGARVPVVEDFTDILRMLDTRSNKKIEKTC